MKHALYSRCETFLKEHIMAVELADLPMVERVYRIEHSLRVARYALQIAKENELDQNVCLLAGVLHDVGKFESLRNRDHGRASAQIAWPFLQTLPLTKKQMSDIAYCIARHCDGEAGYDYEPIPEAGAVSDADHIDRFGVYRVIQALHYDGFDQLGLEEKLAYCRGRCEKLQQRCARSMETLAGTKMFQRACGVQLGYFRALEEELNFTLTQM